MGDKANQIRIFKLKPIKFTNWKLKTGELELTRYRGVLVTVAEFFFLLVGCQKQFGQGALKLFLKPPGLADCTAGALLSSEVELPFYTRR